MQHDDLTRYLAGQEAFIPDESSEKTAHRCERCQRPCSAKYRHCWRCAQYLKVKARLASEQR